VVFAVTDPGEASSGGAARLREAGVDVIGGWREDEGTALLASWLEVQRLGRPHVTVKWAQSLDGRGAAADGTSQWITGPAARADVHRRRSLADAIVVGTGTLLADDPALTAAPDGSLYDEQPRPVVVGTRAVPQEAAVRRHPRPFMQDEGEDLPDLLERLRELGAHRVFVEGDRLASSFLRQQLADEVLVYVAPTLLGGLAWPSAISASPRSATSGDCTRHPWNISATTCSSSAGSTARPPHTPPPRRKRTDVHRNHRRARRDRRRRAVG
jgi:diaminohydroxyphosphoribosylaminopyrimidine deaminase/5-amino-6-(5-phosphoribosylamino)uracil reductase